LLNYKNKSNGGIQMDSAGLQNFAIGYFPNFPDISYAAPEYGLYISPQYYATVSLFNGNNFLSLEPQTSYFYNTTKESSSDTDYLTGSFTNSSVSQLGTVSWVKGAGRIYQVFSENRPDFVRLTLNKTKPSVPTSQILKESSIDTASLNPFAINDYVNLSWSGNRSIRYGVGGAGTELDSTYYISERFTGSGDYLDHFTVDFKNSATNDAVRFYEKYRLPNAQPSTTNGAKSIMTWVGNGSTTTPSFEAQPKKYVALLTQTGTSAPVATVLENSLGGTVVWTRSVAGYYVATLNGAFPSDKTALFPGSPNSTTSQIALVDENQPNQVGLSTSINGVNTDGQLSNTAVMIIVYP
jgi:hypothetical protein